MKSLLLSLFCFAAFALNFGCDDGGKSESEGGQAAGTEVSGGESSGGSAEAGEVPAASLLNNS